MWGFIIFMIIIVLVLRAFVLKMMKVEQPSKNIEKPTLYQREKSVKYLNESNDSYHSSYNATAQVDISENAKVNMTTIKSRKLYNEFVVIDFETTGLTASNDKIIEIGAVKIKDKQIIDTFQSFVNPQHKIPAYITDINGITDEMVKDAPTINRILPELLNFIDQSVIIAHNATFDMKFLKHNCNAYKRHMINPYACTLSLSRKLFPELQNHKLGTVANHLGIHINNAHRAVDDATATAHILIKCISKMNEADRIKASNKIIAQP